VRGVSVEIHSWTATDHERAIQPRGRRREREDLLVIQLTEIFFFRLNRSLKSSRGGGRHGRDDREGLEQIIGRQGVIAGAEQGGEVKEEEQEQG
jgi:hypothetical protein